MLRPNSYVSEHIRKRAHDRGSLVALGQVEPDRLLTDRAAYVTYLEMQLERVTSALLTAQAVQAATQPGPARPGGSAEGQVEPVRQQANRALDLAEEVRRCQEKLDDFSKQAFINLARRIEALEIRGVTSEEEEEKRREAEGKAAEEQQDREKRMVQMVLEVKEEMLRAVAKEVAAAMSAWTREHQSAVSELKSRLSDLREQVGSLRTAGERREADTRANNRRLEELLEATAQEARSSTAALASQGQVLEALNSERRFGQKSPEWSAAELMRRVMALEAIQGTLHPGNGPLSGAASTEDADLPSSGLAGAHHQGDGWRYPSDSGLQRPAPSVVRAVHGGSDQGSRSHSSHASSFSFRSTGREHQTSSISSVDQQRAARSASRGPPSGSAGRGSLRREGPDTTASKDPHSQLSSRSPYVPLTRNRDEQTAGKPTRPGMQQPQESFAASSFAAHGNTSQVVDPSPRDFVEASFNTPSVRKGGVFSPLSAGASQATLVVEPPPRGVFRGASAPVMQIPRSNGWQGAPGPEALDEQAATSERQLGRLTVMMEEVRSSRSPELSRHQLEGSPSVRTSPVVSTVAVGERTDRRPLYSPGSYVRGSGTDAFSAGTGRGLSSGMPFPFATSSVSHDAHLFSDGWQSAIRQPSGRTPVTNSKGLGGKRATASDSEAGRLENLVMQRAAERRQRLEALYEELRSMD